MLEVDLLVIAWERIRKRSEDLASRKRLLVGRIIGEFSGYHELRI
jgi:hypothetical protein